MSSSVWKADKAFSNVQFFNFIAAGEQLGSRVRETNSDDEDENMASDGRCFNFGFQGLI